VTGAMVRVTVQAAAAALPKSLRERYREQWLADVRDASEAGLSATAIALGAVRFAATVARPSPAMVTLTDVGMSQRSRLATALGLSAAVVSLSNYAMSMGSTSGLTGNTAYDLLLGLASGLLKLFVIVAPITAVILALMTRGMSWRVRVAVALFVVACFAPVAGTAIDGGFLEIYNSFSSPGSAAYLFGAVLVVVGSSLVVKVPLGGSVRAAVGSAAAIAVTTIIGLGVAVAAWNSRPFATFQMSEADPMYSEWLRNAQWFGQTVGALFVWWGAIGAALAILVFAFGVRFSARHVRAFTAATVAVVVLATAGVWNYLSAVGGGTYPPALIDVSWIGGQLALIAVVLVAVGNVRYEKRALARVGHGHDVEGSVELL
jgi:hypothetical protein